jgi:nitroreductase
MSQRYSVRSFTDQPVTSQQLLTVLNSAYGYLASGRVLPRIGDDYSLTLFSVNSSGSYIYTPETNSLAVWDAAVDKETIRAHDTGWPSNASEVLVIVWNQTKMGNQYFASGEAGCLTQNIHLVAVSQNLGTCIIGGIDSAGLRNDLMLPSTMIPILVMPLGYPTSPYPAATPEYSLMNGNLPPVQNSSKSFTDTLNSMNYAQAWPTEDLSLQEISNILWAAYGYSSTNHRTTPSAGNVYPLTIYMLDSTGTYRYLAESHSIVQIQGSDKRGEIAIICGNQSWVADAPEVFLVALDSSYNGGLIYDGGVLDHGYVEVGAGCVVQQILLESSAINLSANVVAKGFESWNATTAQTLRVTLNIPSSIVPLYILPVGHVTSPSPSSSPSSSPSPTPSPDSTPSLSPSPYPSPFATPSPTSSPGSTPTSFGFLEYSLIFAVPILIALIGLIFLAAKRKMRLKRLTSQ